MNFLNFDFFSKENKNETVKISLSKPNGTEAKIFYEPDDRDDVDDEDPDDDLNF